jgi:acyl-coenzyme A thioesterase PaaI-like protein
VSPRRLRWLFRIYPPFLFSGIRVTALADDWSHARVELRQRWYNRNYVGTHFGGSLFAMADPFWMILLMRRLGPGYRVWDQAATIDFVKPGRGTVTADFTLGEPTVEAIRAATAGSDKHLQWFETPIRDGAGDIVAVVRKQVYARRSRDAAQAPADNPV